MAVKNCKSEKAPKEKRDRRGARDEIQGQHVRLKQKITTAQKTEELKPTMNKSFSEVGCWKTTK